MYGDSDVIRKRVDQLREQVVEVRSLADQLVARTDNLQWSGRAADAMRARVTERASHLRSVADRHESAADALAAHVQAVDEVKEQIGEVEARAQNLVEEARTRLARVVTDNQAPGVRITPDPDDEVLAGFVPPAPGHKDWLAVELPGL